MWVKRRVSAVVRVVAERSRVERSCVVAHDRDSARKHLRCGGVHENTRDSAPWVGALTAVQRVERTVVQGRRDSSGTESTKEYSASNGWHCAEAADFLHT